MDEAPRLIAELPQISCATFDQGLEIEQVVQERLAVGHFDPNVIDSFETNYVSIDYLQKISDDNLKVRGEEVSQVEKILEQALIAFTQLTKERNVEIAMKEVPKQIKEIRRTAVSEVFKSDIENMDAETREVFDKVLGYVEKKYISGPMKLAKEIILKNNA